MNEVERVRDTSQLAAWSKAQPQAPYKTEHFFSEGQYTRTITVPQGVLIVGEKHRHKTLNIFISGEMLLFMGGEEPAKRVVAPQIFESDAGVQKIAYTITEIMFSNVVATEETDIDVLEEYLYTPMAEFAPLKLNSDFFIQIEDMV